MEINRGVALHQQFFAERHGSQYFHDFFGRKSFAIGIDHAFKTAVTFNTFGFSDGGKYRSRIRCGVNHITRAFPPLLTKTNVYRRQRERG